VHRGRGPALVKLSAYTLESSLVSVISRFAPELEEVKLFQGKLHCYGLSEATAVRSLSEPEVSVGSVSSWPVPFFLLFYFGFTRFPGAFGAAHCTHSPDPLQVSRL
jgi:hypothetical protein